MRLFFNAVLGLNQAAIGMELVRAACKNRRFATLEGWSWALGSKKGASSNKPLFFKDISKNVFTALKYLMATSGFRKDSDWLTPLKAAQQLADACKEHEVVQLADLVSTDAASMILIGFQCLVLQSMHHGQVQHISSMVGNAPLALFFAFLTAAQAFFYRQAKKTSKGMFWSCALFADEGIKLISSVFGKRTKTVNKGQLEVLHRFLDSINAWNVSRSLSDAFKEFISTSVEAEHQAIWAAWNGEFPVVSCPWKESKRAKKAMLQQATSTQIWFSLHEDVSRARALLCCGTHLFFE